MDVGGFTRALQYACDARVVTIGKPDAQFFKAAVDDMGLTTDEVDHLKTSYVNYNLSLLNAVPLCIFYCLPLVTNYLIYMKMKKSIFTYSCSFSAFVFLLKNFTKKN